ncbi:hypothetical protein D3C76_960640 [compost metagenome]
MPGRRRKGCGHHGSVRHPGRGPTWRSARFATVPGVPDSGCRCPGSCRWSRRRLATRYWPGCGCRAGTRPHGLDAGGTCEPRGCRTRRRHRPRVLPHRVPGAVPFVQQRCLRLRRSARRGFRRGGSLPGRRQWPVAGKGSTDAVLQAFRRRPGACHSRRGSVAGPGPGAWPRQARQYFGPCRRQPGR